MERLGIQKTDVTSTDSAGTVPLCLAEGTRPPTPDHLKKYRRSNLYEPGKPYVHWGAADNRKPTDAVYGRPPAYGRETTAGAMNVAPTTSMAQWQLEQKEAIYSSNKREPLGRTVDRGHVLPAGLGDEIPFGVSTNVKENMKLGEVKRLIFPTDLNYTETKEIRDQYIKTHGRFEPGEQRKRDYDWQSAGIDPAATVFGRKAVIDPHGVAVALNPHIEPKNMSEDIVSSRLAAFRLADAEPLGRSHVRGAAPLPHFPEDHRFGATRKYNPAEAGGVKAALTRDHLSEADLLFTGDLGRSKVHGSAPLQPGRTYGVPSVRTDIAPPAKRSVADHRAFGREAKIASLLSPPSGAQQGVFEEDFLTVMAPADMADFFAAAGLGLPEHIFDAVYARAAEADARPDGLATLNTFQQVRLFLESQSM